MDLDTSLSSGVSSNGFVLQDASGSVYVLLDCFDKKNTINIGEFVMRFHRMHSVIWITPSGQKKWHGNIEI